MIAADAAAGRSIILRDQAVLGEERVSLAVATGLVLARPIVAAHDQPPFDAAAMDGWAVGPGVAACDALDITGEALAGDSSGSLLHPGTAIRTATGARLPAGAERVIPQECAREEDGRVVVDRLTAKPHIRPRGGDFRRGAMLLPAGTLLDPWHLALVAAAGSEAVTVSCRPRLKLIVTGDELAKLGEVLAPGQIHDALGPALSALACSWGAALVEVVRVADTEDPLTSELLASESCDIIVLAGGASVGKRDHSRRAAVAAGATLLLTGVDMRPGKPTWFARLPDDRAVLGLPGNPVAALVAAQLFLRPLLRAMQGADPEPRLLTAPAGEHLPAGGPYESWLRGVQAPDGRVARIAEQDTGKLVPLMAANLLIHRPSGARPSTAGEPVAFVRLDRASDI